MDFLEGLNQMVQDAIDEDIKDYLIEQWADNLMAEGSDVLEREIISFASPEIQKQYNEYYKLNKDDGFYFEV